MFSLFFLFSNNQYTKLMEQRTKELDYLKSVFILLMIAFHLVYIGDKYPYAKQIVYTFHMSAFLIISGYLVNEKKDIASFIKKLLWIFIPYMYMEVSYVIMSHILPVRESVPEVTPTVLVYKIFINPVGPYWYLHTLIICSLIYYVAFHCAHMKIISHLIVLGIGLFSVSYWGELIVFANAIYFFAGVIIKQSKLPFTHIFQPSFLAIIPMIILCCFPNNLNRGTLAGIAITYLSISILLYIHSYLSKNIKQYFYFIGRNTLVIFLFSPIFTLLSKIFLPYLLFEPTGILFLIISITFTVSGCIAIAWTMDRLNLSQFFFRKDSILN